MDRAFTLAELDSELAVELAPRHLMHGLTLNNSVLVVNHNTAAGVSVAKDGGNSGNNLSFAVQNLGEGNVVIKL